VYICGKTIFKKTREKVIYTSTPEDKQNGYAIEK
jgi:hypothetical protein